MLDGFHTKSVVSFSGKKTTVRRTINTKLKKNKFINIHSDNLLIHNKKNLPQMVLTTTIYTPPLKNLAIHTEKFEICETVQLLPKAITGKIMFKGCLCIRLPRFYLDRKVFLVLFLLK